MPQLQAKAAQATENDLLAQLLGISSDSPLAKVRSQRADITRYIQGSYDALLAPADPAGVSLVERGLIALRVATLTGSHLLVEHYRDYLRQLGESVTTIAAVESIPIAVVLSPRLAALIKHTDLLTRQPASASSDQIVELRAQGLGAREIVTIAQLISFLSFQVRTSAALQVLQEAA